MSKATKQILDQLNSLANPANVAGMARYGINPQGTLGVSIPTLRGMARQIGRDHALAQELWASGIHEARILAAFISDPKQVTMDQMESWVRDFDSWDVCDQVCANLFDRTPHAWQMAARWSQQEPEFVRWAGFALMAALAWHARDASDGRFEAFFPLIYQDATDERNFVRKAVNWALRQIGKRSPALNEKAIRLAQEIGRLDSKAARWISADALRELTSPKLQERNSA